jgi:hypothetical protein
LRKLVFRQPLTPQRSPSRRSTARLQHRAVLQPGYLAWRVRRARAASVAHVGVDARASLVLGAVSSKMLGVPCTGSNSSPRTGAAPVVPARTWLLRRGVRRYAAFDIDDAPA